MVVMEHVAIPRSQSFEYHIDPGNTRSRQTSKAAFTAEAPKILDVRAYLRGSLLLPISWSGGPLSMRCVDLREKRAF